MNLLILILKLFSFDDSFEECFVPKTSTIFFIEKYKAYFHHPYHTTLLRKNKHKPQKKADKLLKIVYMFYDLR